MAPSVPPLPSGQTRRNSALMRAALYTPPQQLFGRAVAELELRVGRRPNSPAVEPNCAAPDRLVSASAASNAAWCPRRARAGTRRRSRCRSGTPSRSSAAPAARAARAGRRSAPSAATPRCAGATRARRGPLQVRRSRPGAPARGRDVDRRRGGGRRPRAARRRASSSTRSQERDALVPVVTEQLGVEGDDRAVLRRRATNSRACARARAWPRSGS